MATLDEKIASLASLQAKISELEREVSSEIKAQPERSDLIFFYGDGCPYTKKALPFVDCLERHLHRPVVRKETWNDEGNHELWTKSGGVAKCGGVPFFYNATTGATACGAVDCDSLKVWAKVTTAASRREVDDRSREMKNT